jgi:DNA-binding transcriptional ArsR family regulator
MSRLGDALVTRNEMRMRFDEAKHELVEATIEAIEQSGEGMTARELAGEAEVPTCAIMGTMQSLTRRGLVRARRERQTVEYVKLNRDGTVNMNDRMTRTYMANRYSVVQPEAPRNPYGWR